MLNVLSCFQTLPPRFVVRRAMRLGLACAVLALAGCATYPAMQPFSSDGCSLFPDRAPVGKADWCDCCFVHDQAYWRGGSAQERLASDLAFRHCVQAASGSPVLAGAMYGAVRLGGVPWLPSPFRWAYGWQYGRLYRALSLQEEAQAVSLRAEYAASAAPPVCRAPSP